MAGWFETPYRALPTPPSLETLAGLVPRDERSSPELRGLRRT